MLKPGEEISALDFSILLEAGEDLIKNDAVYVSDSDGKAYKCDADDLAKIGFAGFVVDDATTGNDVYIVTKGGIKSGFTGLTPNALQYVSTTAGAITETAPSNFKIVAQAISSTTVRIVTEPTKRVRVYTSSDTWYKPAGLIAAEIEVQAGGGNGATGGSSSNGGAGASGGYGRGRKLPSALGSTETITVGAVAGNSSFGTHIQCTGGTSASGSTGGTKGTATGGDININGVDGADGLQNDGSGSASEYRAPAGSDSILGIGGSPDANASGYGAGGGGATQTASARAGTPGIVIVTEWY